MEYAAVIIILVIAIILLIKKNDKDRATEINKIFEGRDMLLPVEFHNKYYKDKGIPSYIIIDILKLLESCLDTDLSRLNPDDDFSKNLRYLFEFDSMADVDIIVSIENKYGIKISDTEAKNIKTINDLVFFVNSKVN